MQENKETCISNKEYALSYAGQGFKVFPLHYIRDGECSCGNADCHSKGKHPRTANGSKDATSDLHQVELWWTECPEANIGIATGKEHGLMVLDVDIRHGGPDSYARLQIENEILPEPQVLTGGAGFHLYLTIEKDVEVKNATNFGGYSGLDIRGEGGYVVAPPSNHVSGRPYHIRWSRRL